MLFNIFHSLKLRMVLSLREGRTTILRTLLMTNLDGSEIAFNDEVMSKKTARTLLFCSLYRDKSISFGHLSYTSVDPEVSITANFTKPHQNIQQFLQQVVHVDIKSLRSVCEFGCSILQTIIRKLDL